MNIEVFIYPPQACVYVDVNVPSFQPLLVLGYVTDDDGVPYNSDVGDLGTWFNRQACIDRHWICVDDGPIGIHCSPLAPPHVVHCADDPTVNCGSLGLAPARLGIVPVATTLSVSATSVIRAVHWKVESADSPQVVIPLYDCGVSATPSGCDDPDQECVFTYTGQGCSNDRDYIEGDPILEGIPTCNGILWRWVPPNSYDERVQLEYGISIVASPSTPSANPSYQQITDTEYLQTGLVPGVVYNARVQAYLASGIPSVPGSISNIATAAAVDCEMGVDGVRWRAGDAVDAGGAATPAGAIAVDEVRWRLGDTPVAAPAPTDDAVDLARVRWRLP